MESAAISKISSHRVPAYRRHKPNKQAVVTLRGKDFYLGKYGTKESRDLYASLIAQYLEASGQEVLPEFITTKRSSKNITVVEAADQYLTWIKERRTKVELAHVRGMLKCLVWLYENERAAAIAPRDLREARKAMVALGWSRNYVNEQVGRLKRMFKWLVFA